MQENGGGPENKECRGKKGNKRKNKECKRIRNKRK